MVRFSNRCTQALKDYLYARSNIDPNSRIPLASQPLFARHDIRASKKIRPITSGGMWKAIKGRMSEADVDPHLVRIHDFRHYFVTMTYLAKGNLKLSQASLATRVFPRRIAMHTLVVRQTRSTMKSSTRGEND